MARLHAALGRRADRLRLRRAGARRRRRRLAARPQGRRGRRRRARRSGAWRARSRPTARAPRSRSSPPSIAPRCGRRRSARSSSSPRPASSGWRLLPGDGAPRRRTERPVPVGRRLGASRWPLFFALLIGLPLARQLVAEPGARALRQLLPRRLAGLRRRPRGAAAAPGGGRAARLGDQRAVRRRLRRGAGGAGPALHLRRLSRRGDGAGAQRHRRGRRRAGGDLPAVVPARHRRAAVLGRAPRDAPASRRRSAGSTRRSSGSCSPRSTTPCGRARSAAPADVGLALAAFGLLAFWKTPPWLVVIVAAGGGALASFVTR